jgi:putative spermidine/putrescine transport system permease protein/spermidine/putrescine transport system permease protein
MRGAGWNALFLACFVVVIAILYLPIITVGVYAFFPVSAGTMDFSSPTLAYFTGILDDQSVADALLNSLIVALCSSVISLGVSLFYASFLRNQTRLVRGLVEALIYAPFFLPPIVVGLGLLLTSADLGIHRGLLTITLGHTLFTLAITYRIISVRLNNLPNSLLYASADLGANRLQTLRFVVLPHLSSAFVLSGLLAIMLSFDETLITALVSGDTTTLPLRLWAMMRVGFSPSINALVVLVVGLCLAMAVTALLLLRKNKDIAAEVG